MSFLQIAAFLNATLIGYVGYLFVEMDKRYTRMREAEAAAAAARITRTQKCPTASAIVNSAAGAESIGLIVFIVTLMGALFWVASKCARHRNTETQCQKNGLYLAKKSCRSRETKRAVAAAARAAFWMLVVGPAILGMLLTSAGKTNDMRDMEVKYGPAVISSILDELVAPKMPIQNMNKASPRTYTIVPVERSSTERCNVVLPAAPKHWKENKQQRRSRSVSAFKINFNPPTCSAAGQVDNKAQALPQFAPAAKLTRTQSMTELRPTILPRRRGLNLGLKVSTDDSERAIVTRGTRSNSL